MPWIMPTITGIYTVATICMLFVIYGQIRSIRRTERAFLIPVWDNLVHISHPEGPPVDGPIEMHHTFNVDFRNCGKTPAFIRGITAELRLIRSLEALPRIPKYGSLVPFYGDPVEAGKVTNFPFASEIKDTRPFQEIDAEIRAGKSVLFVVGKVRYDDAFGKSHETRYGLRYRVAPSFDHQYDAFVYAGPKKYNEYT